MESVDFAQRGSLRKECFAEDLTDEQPYAMDVTDGNAGFIRQAARNHFFKVDDVPPQDAYSTSAKASLLWNGVVIVNENNAKPGSS